MTLSLRKTSAALAAACVLLAGATACGSDKDSADSADKTENADTTTTAAREDDSTEAEDTAADEAEDELAAGGTEIPCVFFDDDLEKKPTQNKILWNDEDGFTVTGLEKFEPEDRGMVVVASRESMLRQEGPGIVVAVIDGEVVAAYSPNIDGGGFEKVDFTWEGDRLHVVPAKEFIESIPDSQVLAGLPSVTDDEDDFSLCGENVTVSDFVAMRGKY